MLHSNSNTHANQELNKGSNRHGDNTVRAQGVSYNPSGVNTNTNSSYNTSNNPTSDHDSLTNQTSNLNINDSSSNTANPNTKANASTIGGMVQPGSQTSSYNNNTDPSYNDHNSSNIKMGQVQPPSINDLPGSYPKNSSNAPIETASAGNIGHGSSMNAQSLGSNTSQTNPQIGSHTSQYGNTAQDKLSHNTSNVAGGAAVGAGAVGAAEAAKIASSLGSHGNKPPHDASLGVNNSNASGATTGTHSLTNPAHGSSTTTGTGTTLDNHNKLSNTNYPSTHDNNLSGTTTGTHSSSNPTHGVGKVAGGAAAGAGAAGIASSLGSHGTKPPHDASLGVSNSNASGATTGTHSLTNPAHGSSTTTGTGTTLDNHNKLSNTNYPSTHDNNLSGTTTGTHSSSNPTHGAGKIASGAAAGAGAAGVASAIGSHGNKPSNDTSLGANANSASGVTSGTHSSAKPTHGGSKITGTGTALDSHHHKPTNNTTAGAGTYGNAPIGSNTGNHSTHNPTHGSSQVGSVSHPALGPSHDLDAVDTKPSKMGGYIDKMKGAIHEGIGKAFSNEEMIEKGTLEKAQGEQKILLSQTENQSKHH